MYEKEPQNHFRETIVNEALKLVGFNSRNHPKDNEDHQLGCSFETGFDCSGFVKYVLQKSGISVPGEIRHASEFFDHFGVLTHIPRQGDLVFFSRNGLVPRHVGIMINNQEYIHSPGKNGERIEIKKLEETEILLEHPNQLYLKNPIGFKTPTISNGRWQQII
ncbi:MAG: NlpC/P60 family protein [Candidatus Shapirobacteria bacterium]|nr:NlpC/P60 family protein [Candidatus Shapirobacteria bacterium]MDD4410416.1 NlpC/P60 family protein [Candidatus Shapirobacteria bacterium]